MATYGMTNSQARISDPVLTALAHDYAQADSIASFVAPIVPVQVRSGNIVKFTREQFAVTNTRRSPGDPIKRLRTNYSSEKYTVYQHAVGGEVTEEQYQEAINGAAKVDLRTAANSRAAAAVMQSWEAEVTETITDPTLYEASLVFDADADDQAFNNYTVGSASDPEVYITAIQEAIRSECGIYANSAVIDTTAFNAIKFHPLYRDRIKYTTTGTVNIDLLAQWLNLPRGIKVAQRVKLAADGSLVDFMPAGTMVMFYSPEGNMPDPGKAGLRPMDNSDISTPASFYTYQLDGYPIAGSERFDDDRRVFISDVVAEQSIVPVGLGRTGKIGAAALVTGLVN